MGISDAVPPQPGSKDRALLSVVRSWMSSPQSSESLRAESRKSRRQDSQQHFERALSTGHHRLAEASCLDAPKSPEQYVEDMRKATRAFYDSPITQVLVAVLILGGFGIQIWEFETFPSDGSVEKEIMRQTDFYLTLVFAGELALNLFCHWFRPFFADPFNIYDMAVVVVSIVSLFLETIPGVAALRILRVFRLFRLFGKKKGLRHIVTSLSAALLPVLYAFMIAAVVMAVFAVLGVTLFHEKAPEFFGSFTNSMHSMFIVCTAKGWVEIVDVAAPDRLDPHKLFFIAYVIILVWTLLPVVIAVLLNKFGEHLQRTKREEKAAIKEAFRPMTRSPLDPFLQPLVDFETEEDLSQKIRVLFVTLDTEGRGSLKRFCIVKALQQMGRPAGDFSEQEFSRITRDGALCDEEGGVDVDTFEDLVRAELRGYLQRNLSGDLGKCEQSADGMVASVLPSLKLLLLDSGDDPAGQLKFNTLNAFKRAATGDTSKGRAERLRLRGKEWSELGPERGRSRGDSVSRSRSRGRSGSRGRGRGTTAGEEVQRHRGELSESPEPRGFGRVEAMVQRVIEGQNRMGAEVWEFARGEGEVFQGVMLKRRQDEEARSACAVCQQGRAERAVGRLMVCGACARMLTSNADRPQPLRTQPQQESAPSSCMHGVPRALDIEQASMDMVERMMMASRGHTAWREVQDAAAAFERQAATMHGGAQTVRGPGQTVQDGGQPGWRQAAADARTSTASIPIQDVARAMTDDVEPPASMGAFVSSTGPPGQHPFAMSARSFATVMEPSPRQSPANHNGFHSLPAHLSRSASVRGPREQFDPARPNVATRNGLTGIEDLPSSHPAMSPSLHQPASAWGSQRHLPVAQQDTAPPQAQGNSNRFGGSPGHWQSSPALFASSHGPSPMATMASRNLVSAQLPPTPSGSLAASSVAPRHSAVPGRTGSGDHDTDAGMRHVAALGAVDANRATDTSLRSALKKPQQQQQQQQQQPEHWRPDRDGMPVQDRMPFGGEESHPPWEATMSRAMGGTSRPPHPGPLAAMGYHDEPELPQSRLDTGSQSQFLFFTGTHDAP